MLERLVNSLINALLREWVRSRETPDTRRRRALRILRWGWWPLLALGAVPYAMDAASYSVGVAGLDMPSDILFVGWMLLVCGCAMAGSAFGALARDGTPQERLLGLVGSAVMWLAFLAMLPLLKF